LLKRCLRVLKIRYIIYKGEHFLSACILIPTEVTCALGAGIRLGATRYDFYHYHLPAKSARQSAKATRKKEEQENANFEGQLYGTGIAD